MTKKRIVPAIAVLLLALAASPAVAQQPAAAPNAYKIGYVDTQRVMRDSRAAQQVRKELDDEFLRRTREIEAGAPGDQQRRKAALADEMNMKREFSLKQFIDKANDIVKRVAEAEKFDAVFLEAAYFNTRIDLTDRVIKALDGGR